MIKIRTGAKMIVPIASCAMSRSVLESSEGYRTRTRNSLTQLNEMIRTASGAPDIHHWKISWIVSAIPKTRERCSIDGNESEAIEGGEDACNMSEKETGSRESDVGMRQTFRLQTGSTERTKGGTSTVDVSDLEWASRKKGALW